MPDKVMQVGTLSRRERTADQLPDTAFIVSGVADNSHYLAEIALDLFAWDRLLNPQGGRGDLALRVTSAS